MKRLVMALALCLLFALPAQAEVNGMYVGLKFIDALQNTGNVSDTNLKGSPEQYGQNTVGGGIAIGYDFYPKMQVPVRAEVEYALRSNMGTTWDSPLSRANATREIEAQWSAQTLFANFYWDFHNDTAFTPYVGAGLGLAFIKSKYSANTVDTITGTSYDRGSTTNWDTNFAWNVGLGCSYAFNENIALDLAYRFVSMGQTDHSAILDDKERGVETNPYSNEFSLGLRVTF